MRYSHHTGPAALPAHGVRRRLVPVRRPERGARRRAPLVSRGMGRGGARRHVPQLHCAERCESQQRRECVDDLDTGRGGRTARPDRDRGCWVVGRGKPDQHRQRQWQQPGEPRRPERQADERCFCYRSCGPADFGRQCGRRGEAGVQTRLELVCEWGACVSPAGEQAGLACRDRSGGTTGLVGVVGRDWRVWLERGGG